MDDPTPFSPNSEHNAEAFILFAVTKKPLIKGEMVEIHADPRGSIRCSKLKFIGATPRIAKVPTGHVLDRHP